eukprot:TRINITY_DN6374_c0_g1_i1.p2 TRINITY_DN6374_c0_g1~~TRINITY_DN6374_c0_g1_i1.p2  ORF type:complete len:136 (+),score=29.28 TRINITY_DN6374_c0_g1_i1:44-451(+)
MMKRNGKLDPLTEFYYAYGSNMNQERMLDRVGTGFSTVGGAILPNYQLCFNKKATGFNGCGYANVVTETGTNVEGVLYKVTKDMIVSLDGFEGVPHHYTRESIQVLLNGRPVQTWVYLATEEISGSNDLDDEKKW